MVCAGTQHVKHAETRGGLGAFPPGMFLKIDTKKVEFSGISVNKNNNV